MPVLRNETGQITAIICSRPKKCAYCDKPHTKLCDWPKDNGKTCDTPLCDIHTFHPEFEKDYCRVHRRKLEGSEREQQRRQELEAKKRDSLIFIAKSKYEGWCREKDCGSRWEQGEPMYWDTKTREVFCEECGGLMK